MPTQRITINPVGKRGGGSRNVGIGSGEFTNAQDLKNRFLSNAKNRIKAGDKSSGDAGYWTNGRCNWGGNHDLMEDCNSLAVFFNSIASIDNDMRELVLSVDEQEFNTKKQQLTNKLQDCVNKCQVSSVYSIASVCCIWNDYFGSFLKVFLDKFKNKLQSHSSALQNIEPKHQREIIQLEAEIKGAETKYNDAIAKAATETDPIKKAEFIAIAQIVGQTIKQAKAKLANNPLSKLAQYSYLNDLGRFLDGNLSSSPPTQPSPDNINSSSNTAPLGNNGGNGGGSNWNPFRPSSNNNDNQQPNQQQLFIYGAIALIAIYFLLNQRENNEY